MRVLDRDVCVAILRGRRDVIEMRRTVPDDVATTWISAAELMYGAAKSGSPSTNRRHHGRVEDLETEDRLDG